MCEIWAWEIHSRSICKARLKRLLQFLTGLLHFRCDQANPMYRRTLARYSRDTWQIVDVIVGVGRISLSAGMKLMARERYGCTERRRNFAIALCDGNPSKHVCALPAYPRHHMPAVSSHLCPWAMTTRHPYTNYIRMYALRISVLSQ